MRKRTKRIKKLCDCRPSKSGNSLLTKEALMAFFKSILDENKIKVLAKTDSELKILKSILKKSRANKFKEFVKPKYFPLTNNMGFQKEFPNTSFIVGVNLELEADD